MREDSSSTISVFAAQGGDRDITTGGLSRRVWRDYLAGRLLGLAAAVLLMIVAALATGAQVWLVQPAFDKMLIEGDDFWLWAAPLGIVATASIGGLANFGQSALMHKIGFGVALDMQRQLFSSILRADLEDLQSEGVSKQLSRFITDMYLLRDMVIKAFTGIGRDILKVTVLAGIMVYQNWEMSLAAVIFFPLSVYPILKIGRRMRKFSTSNQVQTGEMTSVLDDAMTGARQVKTYNRYGYEEKRADKSFVGIFNVAYRASRTRAMSYPIIDTMGGLTLGAVLFWGGLQIMSGDTTVGAFMAFFTAVLIAYQPVRGLANLFSTLQEGLAAARRVFDVIDYQPSIIDAPDAKSLGRVKGDIALDGVRFGYGGGESGLVIDGVAIQAKQGETVALVGPSGGGKSTILNLIPRFFDVQDGAIRIDDHDIRAVTLESLRENIALVAQDTLLFNDTVRANIAYGRLEASDAEIEAAAKAAAAHDFILDLPQGYDTPVGEHGVNLSGGQRQRIAIARAMLKDAPILLLDEATSALDAESEHLVQLALAKLTKGRTTLVIAHRLSTVMHADRIYVLDKGKVVEQGTHAALVSKGGLYARLSRKQFRDEPVAPGDEPGDQPEAAAPGRASAL
ncbi:MAG: ABC transporter ATP-binding protein [Alphaproteobacteria bacterium]|nr:ABC transporter ATP-binding protein [Alphaproteobacteria bacterium]